MKKQTYLSVITNFGCHWECPYCITKKTGIGIPQTSVHSLDKFEEAINEVKPTIISVSGGGDPLYDFSNHKDFYQKLYEICDKKGLPIEMHTSLTDVDTGLCFCRVVYHLNFVSQIAKIKRRMNERVRVVFVVDDSFDKKKIDDIYEAVKENGEIDELSYRQMVDSNYNPTTTCEDYLSAYHRRRWFYITQGDYNTYYVENALHYNFKELRNK